MSFISPGLTNTSRRQQTLRLLRAQLAKHLGHPHEKTSPQNTEPFWQQHAEILYPHARYYPELDLYTELPVYHNCSSAMDSAPVVIGYKSPHARSSVTTTTTTTPKRPLEFVEIYLGPNEEHVGKISLAVLLRFSRLAKATYPKPVPAKGDEAMPKDSIKAKAESGPFEGPNGEASQLENWADVAEMAHTEQVAVAPTTDGDVAAKSDSLAPSAAPSETTKQKALVVAVPEAWVQPSLSVAQHILTWMEQNKRRVNGVPLLPLTPAPLSSIALKPLIDTYTGVLAYDLVPFPPGLRREILDRLTKHPVYVEQIRYLYDHLPVNDSIINRMITSFFEHDEAKRYSTEQRDAIYTYLYDEVDDEGELERRFNRVKRNRYKQLKEDEAMQKLKEGFESFAGTLSEALPPVSEVKGKQGKAQQDAEESDHTGHRRRNRREQQQAGKDQAKATGQLNSTGQAKTTGPTKNTGQAKSTGQAKTAGPTKKASGGK